MQKRAILPTLVLSLLTLGVLAGHPVSAATGPDPNESGITETADLPEAPEAPEAPEEAPDVEDTGGVDPADAPGAPVTTPPKAATPPKGAVGPNAAAPRNPANAPAPAGSPVAPGAPAPRGQRDSGSNRAPATQTGVDPAAPTDGAPVGAIAAAPDDGTDPVPFVLAGAIGVALGAAGAAALGRRHLMAARAANNPD